MRIKNKIIKKALSVTLALAMAAGTLGVTAISADAKQYKNYSANTSIADPNGWKIELEGDAYKHFDSEYLDEGVGYYLNNWHHVEPVYAERAQDPRVVMGGVKAKIINDGQNGYKLHIEGYYELNLLNSYKGAITDMGWLRAPGIPKEGFSDEGVPTSGIAKPAIKDPESQDPSDKFDGGAYDGINGSGYDHTYKYEYVGPETVPVSVNINGTSVRFNINVPHQNVISNASYIADWREFSGKFSQDFPIKLNGKVLSGNELQSVAINWLLSPESPCNRALPLDGTTVDLSKSYIEDCGYVAKKVNGATTTYTVAVFTNLGETDNLEFAITHGANTSSGGYSGKTVRYARTIPAGDGQITTFDVTIPSSDSIGYISEVHSSKSNSTDTYSRELKDLRLDYNDNHNYKFENGEITVISTFDYQLYDSAMFSTSPQKKFDVVYTYTKNDGSIQDVVKTVYPLIMSVRLSRL